MRTLQMKRGFLRLQPNNQLFDPIDRELICDRRTDPSIMLDLLVEFYAPVRQKGIGTLPLTVVIRNPKQGRDRLQITNRAEAISSQTILTGRPPRKSAAFLFGWGTKWNSGNRFHASGSNAPKPRRKQ